jgi:hypothetical protein
MGAVDGFGTKSGTSGFPNSARTREEICMSKFSAGDGILECRVTDGCPTTISKLSGLYFRALTMNCFSIQG